MELEVLACPNRDLYLHPVKEERRQNCHLLLTSYRTTDLDLNVLILLYPLCLALPFGLLLPPYRFIEDLLLKPTP